MNSSLPIEYSGQLTHDDAIIAMTAFLRRRVFVMRMIALYSVVILAASFFLNPRGSLLAHTLPTILFVVISFVLIRLRLTMLVRRAARRQTLLYQPFTSRIDDTGFATVTARDRVNRYWADFSEWREIDGHFLLIEGGSSVRIVPKRLLGEQVDRLRMLLADHLRRG